MVRYSLSNINSVASTYFSVDSVTGWITVRVPLSLDLNSNNNNQYIVSLTEEKGIYSNLENYITSPLNSIVPWRPPYNSGLLAVVLPGCVEAKIYLYKKNRIFFYTFAYAGSGKLKRAVQLFRFI